jgi:hypothetical protein
MCVRQTRPGDDNLEADLYRYFTRTQGMSDTEATAAAKVWAAQMRRRRDAEESHAEE